MIAAVVAVTAVAVAGASVIGRLGQHQLRGVGLQHIPAVSKQLVAFDEF